MDILFTTHLHQEVKLSWLGLGGCSDNLLHLSFSIRLLALFDLHFRFFLLVFPSRLLTFIISFELLYQLLQKTIISTPQIALARVGSLPGVNIMHI